MLPPLTASFTIGLFLGSIVPYFPLSLSALLISAVVVCSLYGWRRPIDQRKATALFTFLLGGMVYWSLAVERTGHGPFVEREDEVVQPVSGRIVAPVQQAPDRLTMLVKPEADGSPDKGRLIRLTWHTPERMLFQGDRIAFRAKLRTPSGSLNPGGFDYASYLERQGIDAVTTITRGNAVELLESGKGSDWWGIWNQLDRWRGSIRFAAMQSLSQPALGLYLGIVVGDRGYFDADLRESFMVTGTVHLLSISGSHLGLVAVLTFMVIRRAVLFLPAGWLLRLSRNVTASRVAALATVFPVTLYACLAGAEVATIRSLIMVLATLLARWLGYEQRMFHLLAVAAAVILLHDPQAIYDISFQLSFLSVCAIAAWLSWSQVDEDEQPVQVWWRRGFRWGRDAVIMSGIVTLATLPVVAFYFNQWSWLGLFTNVVAVPVMGIVLVPIGLFAGIWHLLVGGTTLPFAPVLQWLLDAFVAVLSVIATVPGAEWHVASPSVFLMLLFYGGLAWIWWSRGPVGLRWVAAAATILIVLWWLWSPRLLWDSDRLRVTFLDVGQGDSAVLELPDGQVVLIDGGAAYERFDMGRGVVAPYLWNRGIRSIDHIVATHPQLDHVGGLTWILKHFAVQHYWATGDVRDELFYQRLQQSLAQRGLREEVVQEGKELLSSDTCTLVVLNPPKEAPSIQPSSSGRQQGHGLNNRSIVTRLTCGRQAMLFTADAERDALMRMQQQPDQQPITVLKVPHHGAISSLSRDWVSSLHPQYAVISVGRHNPYGHPSPAVIEFYKAQEIPIVRTDRDGGVLVIGRRSDPQLHIHRTRSWKIEPIDLPVCRWQCERLNWSRLWQQWLARV
jgi:competence protein ComEC